MTVKIKSVTRSIDPDTFGPILTLDLTAEFKIEIMQDDTDGSRTGEFAKRLGYDILEAMKAFKQ